MTGEATASDRSPPVDRRASLHTAGLLVLLVAVFHGPALRNGFVYDDHWTIEDNLFLRQPANAVRVFGGGPAAELVPDAGRPVLLLTELVDWSLGGGRPGAFHLQSLVWHAAVVLLLFGGAFRLTSDPLAAFTAAALFAVHPLNVEAVACASYREDLLAAFFVLLTLLLARASRQARAPAAFRALAAASLAAGVFSKENAAIAPILLVLLDLCFPPPATSKRTRALEYALLGAVAVAAFLWRAQVMGAVAVVSRTAELSADIGPLARVGLSGWTLLQGLAQTLVPVGLAPEYPDPPRGAVIAGLATLTLSVAAAGFLLIRRRRPWPLAAFVTSSALAAYAPNLGLVPLTNLRADRYFYLPGLALALGLGVALAKLLVRVPWLGRPSSSRVDGGSGDGGSRTLVAVAALVSVLGVRTLQQGRLWRDDLRLWTAGVEAAPGSPRAWLGLADARLRAGNTMDALAAASHAQALADTAEARELLGVILLSQGNYPGAARALAAALALPTTQRARILNNLGFAELRQGRAAQALARFEEARRLAPHFDKPWLNAAQALVALGRRDEARALLAELLRRAPGSPEAERVLRGLQGDAEDSEERRRTGARPP